MSESLLLGIGTIVFIATVWATLAVGYAVFGSLYDNDTAAEDDRRRRANVDADEQGELQPARNAEDVAHDDVPRD